MKPFETAQEQKTEINNINQGYCIMDKVKGSLHSKDIAGAENRIEEIKSLGEFIDRNLPEITEEQMSCEKGFYSPCHMMSNAVKYTERVISNENGIGESDIKKAETSSDQVMRLMGYGMYEKSMNIPTRNYGFRSDAFDMPNLFEIPIDWKVSSEGKDFERKIKEFLIRRKQNKEIDQKDFNLLDEMIELIGGSYKSYTNKKFNRGEVEQVPRARELILINLSLLRLEAEKYEGSQIPLTKRNVYNTQLIKGIFNYNEQSEIEQIKRPGIDKWAESPVPKIIEQPAELRT